MIDWNKERVVIKGYEKLYGIEYEETLSLMA
jgi:hypothetical protein